MVTWCLSLQSANKPRLGAGADTLRGADDRGPLVLSNALRLTFKALPVPVPPPLSGSKHSTFYSLQCASFLLLHLLIIPQTNSSLPFLFSTRFPQLLHCLFLRNKLFWSQRSCTALISTFCTYAKADSGEHVVGSRLPLSVKLW